MPTFPPLESAANIIGSLRDAEQQRLAVELANANQELARLRANVARIFKQVGMARPCRGCGAPMIFLRHRNGNYAPYDVDGTPHHVTCPKVEQFRKKERP